MIVCSCNVISDHAIRAVVDHTLGTPHPAHEIYRSVGYVPNCGRCARSVKQVIKDALSEAGDMGRAACGGLESQPNMVPEIQELSELGRIDADGGLNAGSCGPDCCQNQNRSHAGESLPSLAFDAGLAGTGLALGAAPEPFAQAAE